MGLFNSIFNAAGNSQGYINPAANAASTGTSLTAVQPGGYITIGNGGTSTWSTATSTQASMSIVHTLKEYCELIGWGFVHMYIPDIESTDPKIAILKLAKEYEVIKDIGVRVGSCNFYIMREPRQSE